MSAALASVPAHFQTFLAFDFGLKRTGVAVGNRLLRRALWHFSEHGLAAAAQARTNATVAASRGDREEFHNWLAICQLLDRRMAKALRRGFTA